MTNGDLDRVDVDKMSNAPVEYLSTVSSRVRQFIREDSDEALRSVVELAEQRPGIFTRLLPTPFEKEQRRVAAEQVRQIADNKRGMLDLYTHIQLEIARREGEVLIAARSVETGGVLTAFATQQLEALTDTIADAQERFLDKFVPRQEAIEKYKDRPEVYKRAYEAQQHQLDVYFDTTKALLEDFKVSLQMRLARQGDVRR
jgi:hypothetical protein